MAQANQYQAMLPIARAVMAQANQYQAMGNMAQAKTLQAEVKSLIGRSHALEAQAKSAWNLADTTAKSVGEWQQAGTLAAGHAAWQFSQWFTPTPNPDGLEPWEVERPSV